MGDVVVLSFTAALNPTLLTAATVMLLLPNPKRLMVGYLLGAYTVSIALGIVIVYVLEGSRTVSSTKHTVNPIVDVVLGALALVGAFVLGTGRHERITERRRTRKAAKPDKGPPKWQRFLSKGSARDTFVVGMALTLPGASYLAALTALHKLDYSVPATVLIIVGINLVMLTILELPLLGFFFAPEATPAAVDRAKAWVGRHGRRVATIGLTFVGVALIVKGVVGLLS
jgi:hypothetical protein